MIFLIAWNMELVTLLLADERSIFISGKTAQLLFDKGNDELCSIDDWLA